MNLSDVFRDPRVILWIAAVTLAIIFIGVFGLKFGLDLQGGTYLQLQLQGAVVQVDVDAAKILEKQFNASSVEKQGNGYVITVNHKIPANLPDNLGYSGAKVAERGNTTKITISDLPEAVILNYLKKGLNADVKIVGVAPVEYEIRTNVTRDSLNTLLAPVGGSVSAGKAAFVEGVKPETVTETKNVLDAKLNRLGMQDIKVRPVGNQFIIIDLAGMDISTAQDVVGKPGKFEIRIQTHGNETEHILYGDSVESVDIPRGERTGGWGVPFTLSQQGAETFRKAAIDADATKNPQDHQISMWLDNGEIFSAPLAPELASSLQKAPSRSMVAETGSDERKAKELYIHLREGALPVSVRIVGSGQVAAALGRQFLFQMVIAGIIALLAVAAMIFYRYREGRIAIPMVTTSFSEIIMLLGIWALMGWQLDLASLAGMITVIGTGVDQLIIITDEVILGGETAAIIDKRSIKERAASAAEKTSGKVSGPSGKVYIARLSRAFIIILGAAATTAVAMLPLLYMGFGALTGFALTIIAGVLVGVLIARPSFGRIIGYILAEG